ncbi:MAG: hypothetical protein ABL864_01915 [Terricaulis sp.]
MAKTFEAFPWVAEVFDQPAWAYCYWFCIVTWAITYVLSILPSVRVYESHTKDANPFRLILQLTTAVVLPCFIFITLTGRVEEIYPIIAIAVFFLARAFTDFVALHGPDARSDGDFRFWVRILREGETQHLLREFRRSPVQVLLFGVFCLLIASVYFGLALWAYNLASDVQHPVRNEEISRIIGPLFTGVAMISFALTVIVARFALGMHSVSFPVRYGVAADAMQVFFSATWAAVYPWYVFGSLEDGANDAWKYWLGASILAIYVVFVVWPLVAWRVRFRDERAVRLRAFRRILRRVEVASRLSPEGVEASQFREFQQTSLRKAKTAMERTLRAIVARSPFRAFVMLHVNAIRRENRGAIAASAAPLSLYDRVILFFRRVVLVIKGRRPFPDEPQDRDDVFFAHYIAGVPEAERRKTKARRRADDVVALHGPPRPREQMDLYQAYVNSWVIEERANRDAKYDVEDHRILGALEIGNPQLKKMITKHRYGLEKTDYRYRLMYWCARFLSRMEEKCTPYLNPLAIEALADIEELERRTDSKSLILSVGGAFGTALLSLALALTQGVASRNDVSLEIRPGGLFANEP